MGQQQFSGMPEPGANASNAIRRNAGVLLTLGAAAVWGLLPLFTRFVYAHGADALSAAAMRAYITAFCLMGWALLKGRLKGFALREVPFYLLYGLLATVGCFTSYSLAINYTSVAMAAMLLYTGPSFVILFSRLLFGEPITRSKAVCLALTFVGCALVVRVYDPASLTFNALGILFGLLSGLCYASLTVIGRYAQKRRDMQTNCALQCTFGALIFLFIRPPWLMTFGGDLALGYAALGLGCSTLPYALYMAALERIEGGTASIIATAEPLVATIVGVVFLKEALYPLQVAGIVMVLAGVAYTARGTGKLKAEKPEIPKGKQSLY